MRRIILCAVVLLVISAPVGAVASGAPRELVGTWIHQNGVRMVIKKTNRVTFVAPGFGSESTTVVATAKRVTFGPTPTCARNTVYSWKLSGRTLTFAVVRDPCKRGALWLGPWRKR